MEAAGKAAVCDRLLDLFPDDRLTFRLEDFPLGLETLEERRLPIGLTIVSVFSAGGWPLEESDSAIVFDTINFSC